MAQQVDIGLSILPFDHPDVTAEAVSDLISCALLPARHPLAGKATVGVEDLRNESFISLERDDCSLMTIDRAFQMRGVQKRNQIEVPMSETACSFVANGIGVSILPPFVGMDYPSDQLTRHPLLPKTSMDIWLLTSSRRPLSLAAQQLVEFIRAAWYNFRIHDLRYHPSSKRLTVECDPSQGIARKCPPPRRFRTSACAKHRHIGYVPVWRKAYSWHDDWLRSSPGQTEPLSVALRRSAYLTTAEVRPTSGTCQMYGPAVRRKMMLAD